MKEVRTIEQDIVEFQKELREYIYRKEKEEYAKIGEGKLQEFHTKWEKAFQDFDTESFNKLEQLKELHREQIELLNQKLDRAIMAVKVKPTIKLRELQFQEKLVAANERVDEAINYRKELKNFEVSELERVQKVKEVNAEKERQKLLNMQKKERDELEDKLERKKDKMKIQMQKEFDVLRKQVGMHKDEIMHIQSFLSSLFERKGKHYDELKRFKEREQKTNTFVHAYKEVKEGKLDSPMKTTMISSSNALVFTLKKTLSLTTSLDSTLANNPAYRNIILPLKQLISMGNYAKFDLKHDDYKYGKPINVQEDDNTSTDLKKRVKKLLTQNKPKDDMLPSLTQHYDENLECHSDN